MQPLFAATKVYEKPSVFMKRHFGGIPKTQVLSLSSVQLKHLKSIFGHSYKEKKVRYWQGGGKTAFVIDEVGKSEPITIGVVVKSGSISEIKVLVYRESHGWEVSKPFFTKQFVGATLNGNRLDRSIDGIVGATLSVNSMKKVGAAALYLSSQVGK
ncbi:FMN-binding protein [Rubritalea spongiae]|uniref:FMN-binding protein n=2 Tax=Rubritalea spongiae TaxID=430797 RepID=A0ABW5DXY8_9BACT